MAQPERIPCPFCGARETATGRNFVRPEVWHTVCLHPCCEAIGPGALTAEEAERLWDQRDKRWEERQS